MSLTRSAAIIVNAPSAATTAVARVHLQAALLSAFVFLTALTVFWTNAAPGVTFHDSGEFALAAASGGIPHPPGAPTWVIPATLFVGVGSILAPGTEPGRLTNLFTGLCGAATLALLTLLAFGWTRRLFPTLSSSIRGIAALIAPLTLVGSLAFLEQCFVTEQYTLQIALLVACLLAATAVTDPDILPRQRVRSSVLLGLLVGLAITNHPSQVVLLGLMAVALWVAIRREPNGYLPVAGGVLLGLTLGLATFVYVPLRSLANPLMDWGNIKTPARMLWALARAQWETRPLSEAPPDFAFEWSLSYDFMGQVGVLALGLGLVGLLVLVRKQKTYLVLLSFGSVFYSAGMLLAHLRQAGMEVTYIRQYGVKDWHLSLYLTCALLAGIGSAALLQTLSQKGPWPARTSLPLGLVLLLALAVIAAGRVQKASLRDFPGTDEYVRDILAPIPEDALIVVTSDAPAMTLTYERYGARKLGDRWIAYGLLRPSEVIQRFVEKRHGWDAASQEEYLRKIVLAPDDQPLRISAPTPEQMRHGRLFVEYDPGFPEATNYLLPMGYLFRVENHPVSSEEVRAVDRAVHRQFPHLFQPGTLSTNRLTREARGLLQGRRGDYFYARKMWPEAEEAYQLFCSWLPDNGTAWYFLGVAQARQGKRDDAATSFNRAIDYAPYLEGPRTSLATLLLQAGQIAQARTLLQEEARWHPSSVTARENLQKVGEMH